MAGKLFAFEEAPHRGRNRRWTRPHQWLMHFLSLLLALLVAIWVGMLFERFGPDMAIRHIIALPSCFTADLAGVKGASRGEPGYWTIHDWDRDGVACE